MKLERGQSKDLSEFTGISQQHIHRVLNGDCNAESKSGKKIFTALKIMKKEREDVKKKIKEAMLKIDREFGG